jgi:integrase
VAPTLAQIPDQWRNFFAVAIYTALRRGSIAGLQKHDVDLAGGTITVTRSWDANTPKGKRAFTIPIHPELRPYLEDALKRSPSHLLFSREDGSMHSRHTDLVGSGGASLDSGQSA